MTDMITADACSYPTCGKPSAYLPHPDGLGAGWRHVNPDDETDSHVGYPMERESYCDGDRG